MMAHLAHSAADPTAGPAGAGALLRLALNRREAAVCLGISMDSFERYVQPELRVVRRGRIRLIPVTELERWVAENAESQLAGWERSAPGPAH